LTGTFHPQPKQITSSEVPPKSNKPPQTAQKLAFKSDLGKGQSSTAASTEDALADDDDDDEAAEEEEEDDDDKDEAASDVLSLLFLCAFSFCFDVELCDSFCCFFGVLPLDPIVPRCDESASVEPSSGPNND